MRRRAEKNELGYAETQQVADVGKAAFVGLLQAAIDQRVDLPEPAQRRRAQQSGKGTVARF